VVSRLNACCFLNQFCWILRLSNIHIFNYPDPRFVWSQRVRIIEVQLYIHTYMRNLYINTIIFKATKARGVVYSRIKPTYSTAKHIYKSNKLYVFKNLEHFQIRYIMWPHWSAIDEILLSTSCSRCWHSKLKSIK